MRKAMSFFRKIIDWFYEDEEEEIAVEPHNNHENIQKKPKPQGKRQNNQTEIEARIQYRYPKENFKFPLISDEELMRLKEQKKKQKDVSGQYGTHVRETKITPSVPTGQTPYKRVVTKPEPKQTKIMQNKIPFRRTEIPSPIYGFQNRQIGTKNQKTVEYELPSETTLDSVLALMHGKNEKPLQVKQEYTTETKQGDMTKPKEIKYQEMSQQASSNSLNENQAVHTRRLDDDSSGYISSVDEKEVAATREIEWNLADRNQVADDMSEAILNADLTIEDYEDREEVLEDSSIVDHEQTMDLQEESLSITTPSHQLRDEQVDNKSMEYDWEFQQKTTTMETDTVLQGIDDDQFVDIEKDTDSSIIEENLMSEESSQRQSDDTSTLPSGSGTYSVKDEQQENENREHMTTFSQQTDDSTGRIEDALIGIYNEKSISNESIPSTEEESPEEAKEVGKVIPLSEVEEHGEKEFSLLPQNNHMVEGDHKESTIDEEEKRRLEREKRIKERRKHIPFNVLMLKNDKDYLASNRQQRADSAEEKKSSEPAKKKLIDSYQYPDITILKPRVDVEEDADWLAEQAALLDDTLEQFNVKARVHTYSQGPSVTRFEVQPEPGVKVSKITNLNDDLKLSLAAKDIRIEAPIPGKRMIGIEIPNMNTRPVYLREVLEEQVFKDSSSPLSVAVGLDISGNAIVTDLRKMPHGLVAGSTGSGKSVFINSVLISLLYKSHPSDVRLLLIDPKMVELAPYNNIPHLAAPVITDVKAATAALKWAVEEMERRYELFAHSGVRDIVKYNEKVLTSGQLEHKLPYLVIVIDELADLMMMSPADVEEAICRIAQKARACGIHLLVATQRPSVDVITGLIKANIPTRIAFSVSSQVDSRTILDQSGAEKLLGRGDMLFLENGTSKTVRLQGTFVTDEEIEEVVKHVSIQAKPSFMFEPNELVKTSEHLEEKDELYYDVCEFAVEMGGASISSLQRRFRIGYNRAARLIDILEREGILSEAKGSKPRDVLISESDLEAMQESHSTF